MQSIRPRRTAARSFRFAPVSDEPSGRLQLAAGYFLLTGGFGLVATFVALVAMLDAPVPIARWALAIGAAINLAFCAAHIWTGRQLSARSRRGGKVAIALLAMPLLNLALGTLPSALSLGMSVVGIAIIVSVWEELR